MYNLFGNFVKNQGLTSVFSFVRRFHQSNSITANQKIAIIGSGPKALMLKKSLYDLKIPKNIYQFSTEENCQGIIQESSNVPFYKQILRSLDPTSVFLTGTCKPELLFRTVDRLLDAKLGLKRIFSDVSTMSHATGKIDIHVKAQELPSHFKLSEKTYKDFDTVISSSGDIVTPPKPPTPGFQFRKKTNSLGNF